MRWISFLVLLGLSGCLFITDEQRRAKDSYLNAQDLCDNSPGTAGPTECMAVIPAGTFTMGSPTNEVGRNDDETQHEVTLTHSYYIGATEVSQAQFEAVMGYPSEGFWDSPMWEVTWYEAAAFTNALSDAAGLAQCYSCSGSGATVSCDTTGSPYDCEGYRLPTEAEWEYAARSDTTSAFYNGGNIPVGEEEVCDRDLTLDNGAVLADIAWLCGSGANHAPSVGSKLANAWGLYDTAGNVGEWCNDWYDRELGDETNPLGSSTESSRVFRGGDFYDRPSSTRAAGRHRTDPSYSSYSVGLRIVRSMP